MKLEIPSQDRIEIGAMCSGHVVIQQTVSGGDNYMVFIAANNVDIICEMLQEQKQITIELHKKYLQKKTDWLVNKENIQ